MDMDMATPSTMRATLTNMFLRTPILPALNTMGLHATDFSPWFALSWADRADIRQSIEAMGSAARATAPKMPCANAS